MIAFGAWIPVPPKSWNIGVDPFYILHHWVLAGPGTFGCQILRGIEKHDRWQAQSTCAPEMTRFGFSTIVLDRS